MKNFLWIKSYTLLFVLISCGEPKSSQSKEETSKKDLKEWDAQIALHQLDNPPISGSPKSRFTHCDHNFKTKYWYEPICPKLNHIELFIKTEAWKKLETVRKKSIPSRLLSYRDKLYVEAQMKVDAGETINTKIRLKGDWSSHWQHLPYSFKFKLEKGSQFKGMRSFAIQSINQRGDGEALYLAHARDSGLIAPDYSYAYVSVNGKFWGAMAVEESFSKDFADRHTNQGGGIVFSRDERYMWDQRQYSTLHGQNQWHFINALQWPFKTYRLKKILKSEKLQKEWKQQLGLLRAYLEQKIHASEIFDIRKVARFHALSGLWGAFHAQWFHNVRIFYNRESNKFEPVAFDGDTKIRTEFKQDYSSFFGLLKDPDIFSLYQDEVRALKNELLNGQLQQKISLWEETLWGKKFHIGKYLGSSILLDIVDQMIADFPQIKEKVPLKRGPLQGKLPLKKATKYSEDFVFKAFVFPYYYSNKIEFQNVIDRPIIIKQIDVKFKNGTETVLVDSFTILNRSDSNTYIRLIELPATIDSIKVHACYSEHLCDEAIEGIPYAPIASPPFAI